MKKISVLLLVCLFVLFGCDFVSPAVTTTAPTTTTKDGCLVTFDSCGGSYIKQMVVEKGEKLKEPPAPTKDCRCEFDGWYLGDEKWSFVGYVVTEDMTLTAKWIDCFGLNDKEFEILSSLSVFEDKYEWRDIESIRKTHTADNMAYEYKLFFKDGFDFTVIVSIGSFDN